ncbi:MAG: hypothetical protein WAN27_20325, partial [Xanthobacteraceae bacterium]
AAPWGWHVIALVQAPEHEADRVPAHARRRVEACWSWSNSSVVLGQYGTHHSAAAARPTGPSASLVRMWG